MNEYNMIKRTLQNETFPGARPWLPPRTFDELSYAEQAAKIKKEYQIILGKFIIESNQVKSLPGKPLFVNEKTHFMSILSEVSVTEDTSSKG